MKTLSIKRLKKPQAFIFDNCSELTKQLFIHHFQKENYAGVISALSAYQNKDGGFGHNLEGDFSLPDSSPMATSVAFQILTGMNASVLEPLVRKAILYLNCTMQMVRRGWVAVPPEVNNYPHASWWHYHPEISGSVIDKNWGNPTAEIIGYLLQYRSLVVPTLLDHFYQFTLNYLKNHPDIMEMHEVYCFLRFAERMPASDFETVKEQLTTLVLNAVSTDPQSWSQYAAQPLDFVKYPGSFLYPSLKPHVETNLDCWVDLVKSEGVFSPAWSWEDYPEAWQKARVEIIGRMTVDRLAILKRFGRIK